MAVALTLTALLTAASAHAAAGAPSQAPARELSGGQVEIVFNRHVLADLALSLSGNPELSESEPFSRRVFEIGSAPPSLVLTPPDASFRGLAGGSLWLQGELELTWEGGRLDLSTLELVPSSSGGAVLGLRTLDGLDPFFLDNAHARYRPNTGEYELLNLDLRVAQPLAQRLGRPELEGLALGAAHIRTRVAGWTASTERSGCVPDSEGDVDVELIEIGSLDEVHHDSQRVAMAPSARLRNVGTVDLDWYRSILPDGAEPLGDPSIVGPHPYLLNQLYRLSDGSFQQIGRADVKHAFFATNSNCACAGEQILRVGCEDIYSSFTNTFRRWLAPRDEVTASSGEWTRFGSHFDGAPADDLRHHDDADHADPFEHRLTAAVSDLQVAGARYFVESWYVARGDTNIFNSIGYREVVPTQVGDSWSFPFAALDTLQLGPALDAWVNPASPPPGAAATVVADCDLPPNDCEGHLQIAGRTAVAPNGLTRFDFAVMNLDFDRQIDSFSVPLPPGIEVTNMSFRDPDEVAGNDWTASVTPSEIRWDLPGAETSALDWGTLYSFRFEANATATDTVASLGVFEAGTPVQLTAAAKGPSSSLFGVSELTIALQGSGTGTVTSTPAGVDCGSDCDELYATDTAVSVSAAADPGAALIRWTENGVAIGSNDHLETTLATDRSLVAHFELCDRTLGPESVLDHEVFEACDTLRTGPSFIVESTGSASLRAGAEVGLANGVSVLAGGELSVEIDPALLP